MAKTLTLRIDDATYKSFVTHAKADNRSLSNFVESAVRAHIRECAFADDSEMAGILANDQLVARLKKGSREAKRKKGSLVG